MSLSGPAEANWLAVKDCYLRLCSGVDTPFSLKASMLLENEEYEQLLKLRVNPVEYTTAHTFGGDYALSTFLKKNVDIPFVTDAQGAAIAGFNASEIQCKDANDRIELFLAGGLEISPAVNEVIHLASRKISELLRGYNRHFKESYSWGPGATFDLSRSKAYPDTKIVNLPFTVTGSAWKHAADLIKADLNWKEAIIAANPDYKGVIFKVIPGGRYDTVRKTVLTDRSILVEPTLNTVLQKTEGQVLRALLKSVGVDLDDQSRNQVLASMAHQLDLATLDLESASDSISRKVVQLLLPPSYFEKLDDLRSKWYQDKQGKWHRLEKFSSMGNGFTFELESLIFWSLASAVTELSGRSIVGVYGDDIIVHRENAPLLTEVFTFLGFVLNKDKSFVDGNFFESCGKHYFEGHDVTPIYQKCTPSAGDEAARMGNRILRLAHRLGSDEFLDKRFQSGWKRWIRHWNPKPDQCGPFIGEGDGYWETTKSHFANRTRVGPFGHWCRVLCYGNVEQVIPAIDEAMLALLLMREGVSDIITTEGNRLSKGKFHYDLSIDPKDSITRISKKGRAIVTSNLEEIGYIASRVKPRTALRHRTVNYSSNSTSLTW